MVQELLASRLVKLDGEVGWMMREKVMGKKELGGRVFVKKNRNRIRASEGMDHVRHTDEGADGCGEEGTGVGGTEMCEVVECVLRRKEIGWGVMIVM